MSIEAGIGEKTEKALEEKKDKPDLSSVFADWKNNTSKAENQTERAAVNKALHKVLPNLSIIDFTTDEKGEKYVTTFDGESNKLQLRTVSDFSAVNGQESDLTKAMVEKKATDEQVVRYLSDQVDDKVDAKKETETRTSPETKISPETKTNGDQPKSDETKNIDVKQYEIQPGDNLWKIARREIAESNKANGKPDAAPSTVEVKAFIEKIVTANQSGDNPVKNANLIYAGKTLNIPVEKKDTTTPTDPAAEKKEVPTTPTDPAAEKKEVPTTPTDPAAEKKEVPTTPTDPAAEKKEVPTTPTDPAAEKKEVPTTPTDPAAEKKEVVVVNPASANSDPSGLFTAKANTYENPTIGAEEAAKESAVLSRYFEQMRKGDGDQSGADYLTADEIKMFVESNRSSAPAADGKPVPTPEEIQLLEKAAKRIYRIASTNNDELFSESAATRIDIDNFAAQEKDFEGQYQARFYLERHFDRLAPGKDYVSVVEIKAYRNQLKDNGKAAELMAVNNLLDQLDKARFTDASVLRKSEAKFQIRNNVAGYSYQEYGGAYIPVPAPASK